MEIFLNRLDICFNNALLTEKKELKESSLNKVLILLRYCRMTVDLINYLYSINKNTFIDFIYQCDKPSLILLTYDLEAIGKAIEIPDNTYIAFYNNSFHIEYIPNSPKSDSSSINDEWGLSN